MRNYSLSLVILLFFSFGWRTVYPQSAQTVDSLLLKLYQEPKDSSRIEILLRLSETFQQSGNEFERAREYLEDALSISEMLTNKSIKVKVLNALGSLYRNYSKYNEALKYHNDALSIAREIGDKHQEAFSLNYIGVVYRRIDNHAFASEYHLKALLLAEAINDSFNISIACNSLGNIFSFNGRYDESLNYFSRALAIAKDRNNLLGLAMNYNNIGEVYEYKKEYKRAADYYKWSLEINRRISSEKGIAINYNALGKIELYLGNYRKALDYFEKALKIDLQLGDQKFIADSYINLASVQLKLNKPSQSIKTLKKGLDIALHIRSLYHCQLAYRVLSDYYRLRGDYKLALDNFMISASYKDSLLNEKNARHIATIQTIYETQKKENEIKLLLREQEIKEKEMKRQDMQTIALIVVLFLSAVSILAIYLAFRTKRKTNLILSKQIQEIEKQNVMLQEQKQEIQEQKEEIEENKNFIELKNKNLEEAYKLIENYIEKITDSIRYAERIQESIQPSQLAISKVFSDTFIFNRPKDIVSGDFYWMSTLGTKTFFALADCTGHGVPGAFMSIIGIDMLNQAVNQQKFFQTDEILRYIDHMLIKRLSKSKKEMVLKDSLDIALCVFDKSTYTLEYSGALIPLFIQSDDELMEIKPNHITLGTQLTNEEKLFRVVSHRLKSGDWIYITTDGYFDQLGGTSNKKFMRSRFKQLILDLSEYDGAGKKNMLEKEFLSWMDRNEQIDDVLVWGIRIP